MSEPSTLDKYIQCTRTLTKKHCFLAGKIHSVVASQWHKSSAFCHSSAGETSKRLCISCARTSRVNERVFVAKGVRGDSKELYGVHWRRRDRELRWFRMFNILYSITGMSFAIRPYLFTLTR